MKQVLRRGPGEMVVRDVPEPIALPHQVLIRPAFSLISAGTEGASIHREALIRTVAARRAQAATVLAALKQNGPRRTIAEVLARFSDYAVLGYAGAGVVVACHPTVNDVMPGERVAYGGEGSGHGEVIAAARRLVAPIPDNVPFEAACFTTLGSIALNAMRIAQIQLGETVTILGLGLVGQLIAQLARLQGGIVIAVDVKPERIAVARTLGAHHGFNADDSLPSAIAAVTDGRLADHVIIAAASRSARPCTQGLEICRDRGRLVVVGAVELSFPWHAMYLKEIQLLMSRGYGPGCYDATYERGETDYPVPYVRWTEHRNMQEFLRLLSRGEVDVQPLITHTFQLTQAPAAYDVVLDSARHSLGVVLKYAASDQEQTLGTPSSSSVHRVNIRNAPRPESAKLRVALVGAGNIARWAHLQALRAIPYATLHAVHSTSGVRGRNYAERFGAMYCATEFEEILSDPEIDIVLITSRDDCHADQALRALRAGKHVFLEKPLARTEDECRLLCDAVRDTGRLLTVGFNRRFAPDYLRIREALNAVRSSAVVHCRINSPGISGSYWMAGAALVGEACHFIDLMHWLLASEPVRVAACSLPATRGNPIGPDNVAATLEFANGSIGTLAYCTVGSRASAGERVEVFAPGVAAVAEDFRRSTVTRSTAMTRRRWFPEKGYGAQLRSFVEAVRDARTPAVTVYDGRRATVVALRMLEAARTRTSVAIER